MMDNPKYTHNCEDCIFLGSIIDWIHRWVDLYVHWDEHEKTVISRWGSRPEEYASGFASAATGVHPELAEALRRGLDEGLIPHYVAVPVEIRRCWIRPQEDIWELEEKLFEGYGQFLYEQITTALAEWILPQHICRAWREMFAMGWISVEDPPQFRFMVSPEDPSVVSFGWVESTYSSADHVGF